jgi:Family of unknown function (DUF6869)
MSEAEIAFEEVADAYLRYIAHHNDDDFWAFQKVDELLRQLGDGFRIVTLLIEKAYSDDELAVVAAGPLEDFLDLHSFNALNLVEQAAENPRVRKALSKVGVSFWHELFERWYSLQVKYGFSEAPTQNATEVVTRVTQCMRDFLAGEMQDWKYQEQVIELLSKPIESLDEKRKSILRQADWDCEMFDGSELMERVRLLLHQLESVELPPTRKYGELR